MEQIVSHLESVGGPLLCEMGRMQEAECSDMECRAPFLRLRCNSCHQCHNINLKDEWRSRRLISHRYTLLRSLRVTSQRQK